VGQRRKAAAGGVICGSLSAIVSQTHILDSSDTGILYILPVAAQTADFVGQVDNIATIVVMYTSVHGMRHMHMPGLLRWLLPTTAFMRQEHVLNGAPQVSYKRSRYLLQTGSITDIPQPVAFFPFQSESLVCKLRT
jgi:hypothetical protein